MKLPNFDFMLSWRCCFYLQDFLEFIKRTFGIVWHTTFPTIPTQPLILRKIQLFEMARKDFLNSLKQFGGSKIQNNWVWDPWTRPWGQKSMTIVNFRVFRMWILKVTCPKWSRIDIRSFWVNLSIKFKIEQSLWHAYTPHFDLFPDVLGFSTRNMHK